MALTLQRGDVYIPFTLIDVSILGCGFQIIDAVSGNFFVLVSSNAVIDHTTVEAVLGRPDLRWQFTGQNAFIPIAGGGPGLNKAQIFVSPLGNDSNDGSSWQLAVKTGFYGYALLAKQGGGTLNIADSTHWVDVNHLTPVTIAGITYTPIAGQGPWFRSDPVVATVAGFLPCIPCNIVGWGPGAQGILQTPFQQPGTAILFGGSNLAADNRTKPGIWSVYCPEPMNWYNIQVVPELGPTGGLGQSFYPFRTGWDYNRNDDGSIAYQAISSATRSGSAGAGSTTFTVALAPAVTVATGSVQRKQSTVLPGNPWVVHVTLHRPGNVEAPPWGVNGQVWFATADPAFTSGAYTLLWVGASTLAASVWDFEFSDGSTTPITSVDPVTIRSTVAVPGSLVDVETTSAQFPSTQYPVTAVSATNATTGTITVLDIYGGYSGINVTQGATALTSSRLVHHERDLYMCIGTKFYNCTSRKTQDVGDLFRMGPMFDYGGETTFTYEMHDCYLVGYKPLQGSGIPYDDKRMSAVFGFGGSLTAFGLIATGVTAQQASFRVIMGHLTSAFGLTTSVFDTDNSGEPPAAYVIDGDGTSYVTIDDVVVVDNGAGFGAALNQIRGIPALNIVGNCASGSTTGSVAPSSNPLNAILASGLFSPKDGSAWSGRCVATWADLQISGKHPASWRHLSPVTRRFSETARATSAYGPTPTATGIADPLGGTGAVRYNDSANFNIAIFSFDHTFTFSVGDRLLVSGWVRASAYSGNTMFVVTSTGGGVTWDLSGTNAWTKDLPFQSNGWQFVSEFATVTATSGVSNLSVVLDGPGNGSGNVMDLFGWSIAYVPVASAGSADISEFAGALRAMPHYLPAGMAGTFEGQKLVAHGGLGIDTSVPKVAGAGSGQLTVGSITTYEPRYAADGVTIIGWAPLYAATVNP